MPVQVLLRGFEPDLAEDQTVTFSDDLPLSVLCIECKNVSSKLYKDPNGHAYCGMCKVLGTTADSFNCSRCQEMFNVEKLVIDETIRHQLRKKMVICPDNGELEALEIPFPALKTYLKGISSESASGVSRPGKDDHGTQLKGNNPQSTCVICKQTMPKKTLTQHVKSCLSGSKQGRLDSRPGEGNTQQAHGNNTIGGLKTKVECPLCSTLLDRKDVAQHISEKCPKRVVQCKFCRGDVESCNKEVHEASCRHQPGMCEHCQKEFRTIAELQDEHYPKCEEMPVNCSFHKLGCTFVAARREQPAHGGTTTHADLLIGHICKLQAENQNQADLVKGTVSALQEEVKSLQRMVTKKDNEIEALKQAVSALEDEITKNDTEHLKSIMSALQVDTRNLQQTTTQSNCDTDILKKTVSVLQEDMKSLQTEWKKYTQLQEQVILNSQRQIQDHFRELLLRSTEMTSKENAVVLTTVQSLTEKITDEQKRAIAAKFPYSP
ncbi:uncharacterized protein LOC144143135 [Haemaphysalis longicornis]